MKSIADRIEDRAFRIGMLADNLELVSDGLEFSYNGDESRANAVRSVAKTLKVENLALMELVEELHKG